MALNNPDESPREFFVTVAAIGLRIFRSDCLSAEDAFNEAERLIAEAERRFGKLDGKPGRK
jgi:hypothetical protein